MKYVIQATITKTIEAYSEDQAHDMFSAHCNGDQETYDQVCISAS